MITRGDTVLWFEAVEQQPRGEGADFIVRQHAKTYGTPFAACGRDASSFMKRWDVPFAWHGAGACPRCTEAVAALAVSRQG